MAPTSIPVPLFADEMLRNDSRTPSSALSVPAVPTASDALLPAAPVTAEQVAAIDQHAQDKLSALSRGILEATKVSEASEMGALLNQLVITAKGLDPTAAPSGFLGRLMHRAVVTKEQALAHYQSVQQRMDVLVQQITARAQKEVARIAELQAMEDANMAALNDLAQAQKALQGLVAQAQAYLQHVDTQIAAAGPQPGFDLTKTRADAQAMVDFTEDRLDNSARLMLLAKQRAPQLRIMLDNARALVQKFSDIQTTVIPAWSDRLALYIAQMDQKGAAELATAVFDASDEALRKQADALRQGTAEVAALKKRAVVSTDALTYANEQLIATLDDMNKAAEDTRQARVAAQATLQQLEAQLVQRLIKPQDGTVLLPRRPA